MKREAKRFLIVLACDLAATFGAMALVRPEELATLLLTIIGGVAVSNLIRALWAALRRP